MKQLHSAAPPRPLPPPAPASDDAQERAAIRRRLGELERQVQDLQQRTAWLDALEAAFAAGRPAPPERR